jgi:hypothetical protein
MWALRLSPADVFYLRGPADGAAESRPHERAAS